MEHHRQAFAQEPARFQAWLDSALVGATCSEAAELLLQAGADPSALDAEALTQAALSGNAELAEVLARALLLQPLPRAGVVDQVLAAATWAEESGHLEVASLLREQVS